MIINIIYTCMYVCVRYAHYPIDLISGNCVIIAVVCATIGKLNIRDRFREKGPNAYIIKFPVRACKC